MAFKRTIIGLLLSATAPSVWARGGGGCLAAGTLIETKKGLVPIEKIQKNDEILSPFGFQKAMDRIAVESSDWYEISLPQRQLKATGEHPFFISADQLQEARFLRPGDPLFMEDGSFETIVSIEHHQDPLSVYNLIIPSPGIYVADGVRTHNKGCFVPETPVLMADGHRKPISEIQVGETVLGFDSSDHVVPTQVRKIYSIAVDRYYELSLEDGSQVKATAEHPFYVGHGNFQLVSSLKPGDFILVLSDQGLHPQIIRSITEKNEPTTVYNLQTDEPHTFFAAQVAVHNKGGGGGGGGFRSGRSHFRSRICKDENGNVVTCPRDLAEDIFDYIYFGIVLLTLGSGLRNLFRKKISDGETLDVLIASEQIEQRAEIIEMQADLLAAKDARFQTESCRKIAETAFRTLQEVWEAQKYAPMQGLVFENLAKEHVEQLRSMYRNHEINQIKDLKIHFIRIVDFEKAEKPDDCTFSALVEAEATDIYVDSRTGKFLRGDQGPQTFQEIWIFQWREDRWLLREIEQTRETKVFSRPYPNSGSISEIKPAQTNPRLQPLERKVEEWSQTEPAWKLEKLERLSRDLSLGFLMAFESQSIESLNNKLTDRFYQTVMKDIENVIKDHDVWEFRNLCIRKTELILAEKQGRQGPRFASRITLHAQRRLVRKGVTLREDAYVTIFKMEAWFQLVNGEFLLDDMKVET